MLCLNHFLLPHRISLFPTRGYSEKPSESASKLARSQNYKEEIAAVDSSWWRGLPTAAKKKKQNKTKRKGKFRVSTPLKKKKKKKRCAECSQLMHTDLTSCSLQFHSEGQSHQVLCCLLSKGVLHSGCTEAAQEHLRHLTLPGCH